MSTGVTISPSYLRQQQELHKNPAYGTASRKFAPFIKQTMEEQNVRSLSDYGAGKCNLRRALIDLGVTEFEYFPYDPVFPEYGPPTSADLVCCIDVLEHVEEDFLDAVLGELRAITRRMGWFSVHTGAAVKFLPDGRNAHLIQQPASWWLPRLCSYFEIAQMQRVQNGFFVVVEPLKKA